MGQSYELVVGAPPEFVPLVLDADQQRVAAHRWGPLAVLAGPGTGKTTTVIELVARRIEEGLDPERILLLTFSRRAADELRERLALRLAAAGHSAPTATTFHAFCWSLIRSLRDPMDAAIPLRLLSGPEQDVDLREMLAGSLAVGRPQWPAEVVPGLRTAGMAAEVQRLFAATRALGWGPEQLEAAGRAQDRPAWVALGQLFEDYLDALDPQGKVDYAELVHRAVLAVERDPACAGVYDLIVVDEVQDTDPAQERLLKALIAPEGRVRAGAALVVVGDPDQSIYRFRGADPGVLTDFPDRFRSTDGRPAEVLALHACRRSASTVLRAGRALATGLPQPLRASVRQQDHRTLTSAAPEELGEGSAELLLASSASVEAELVADLLRREHLQRQTPWSRMAVLVRGSAQVPALARALITAGVPVQVGGDEVPLAQDPAVAPLVWTLRAAAIEGVLPSGLVRDLLTGPVVGADALVLRRLGRELRARDDAAAVARPSSDLIALAVTEAALLQGIPDALTWPINTLATLLGAVRTALAAGPVDGLWAAWDGSRMRVTLESQAGSRAADRDLDAVVALFAALERSTDRHGPGVGISTLLEEIEAQQIPADTLADRGITREAVRLLTAHRSKGLEWDVVVVASVQDGSWPDLRQRGSFLQPELLGAQGQSTPAELLAEERRLFYVAVTRARRRLLVTAVAEETLQPSVFVTELGLDVPAPLDRAPRSLSVTGIVADLRRRAEAGDSAAVAHLARLASAVDERGNLLVPQAHPDSWWGLLEPTSNDIPLRPTEDPVRLSGSALSTMSDCSLRWFLGREAGGVIASGVRQGFGSVVHAVAEEIAQGRTPPDPEAIAARLDSVWQALPYEAPWLSERERADAVVALERFVRWHLDPHSGGQVILAEPTFDVVVPVGDEQVRLTGRIDRIVRRPDGTVHVQDLKTSKTALSGPAVASDPQLGVYQLAVDRGGVPGVTSSASAELVYPRLDVNDRPKVVAQEGLLHDPAWIEELLSDAAGLIRAEAVTPSPGGHCRICAFVTCCPARAEGVTLA